MPLIIVKLNEPAPVQPGGSLRPPAGPLRPRPFRFRSTNVSQGRFPGRGLLYSFLIHEIAFFSVLLFPSLDYFREPALPKQQVLVIDLNSPEGLRYFPRLHADDESEGARSKDPEVPQDEPAETAGLRTKGLTYPGPQRIVSDVADATNRFQTLLRPALENPPVVQVPIPLPNIIQMADAGPVPKLWIPELGPAPKIAEPALPPPLPPTVAQKGTSIPTPSGAPSITPKVTLPSLPAAPVLPVPEKPVELTTLRKDLIVASPSQRVAPRPKVVLPPAAPALPGVEKPIEQTFAQKDLLLSFPSQDVSVRPSVPLLNTTPSLAVPAPVRPAEPEPAKIPPQTAATPIEGPDPRSLLSVTPLPTPPQPSVRVPAAEARGRFAVSPDSNLTAPSVNPGAKADNLPTTAAGAGAKADAAPNTAVSGAKPASPTNAGSPDGKTNVKDGSGNGEAGLNTGRGNRLGDTPAKSPFPGITIQGGRLESATGVVSGSASPRTGTVALPNSPPSAAPKTSYNLTIVSTATSGGGLPDLGVFSNEQVYTVYLDMKDKTGAAAPSWTLQYALAQPVPNPSGLVPPFPMVQEQPDLPVELVRKYLRRLVVVHGIIDAAGKLQQMAVKQSPDPQLNAAVLAALSKWVFRPAEVNGSPASVKILMGIPLTLPQ
jgi:hypothetical protein